MLPSKYVLHIGALRYDGWDTVDKCAACFQSTLRVKLSCLKAASWEHVDQYFYIIVLQDGNYIHRLFFRFVDKVCQMSWIPIQCWSSKHMCASIYVHAWNTDKIIGGLIHSIFYCPAHLKRRDIERGHNFNITNRVTGEIRKEKSVI